MKPRFEELLPALEGRIRLVRGCVHGICERAGCDEMVEMHGQEGTMAADAF